MGADTASLKQEIEGTRSDLSETLDAIGDRVSPGRVIERRKNRMVRSVESLRHQVMGTAHDAADGASNVPDMVRERTEGAPVVAGALAFGVGFLLAAVLPTTRPEQQVGSAVLDKAQPVKDQILEAGKEIGQQLAEPAKESAMAIKDAAASGVQTVVEEAKDAKDEAVDKARAGVEKIRSGDADGQPDPPSSPW